MNIVFSVTRGQESSILFKARCNRCFSDKYDAFSNILEVCELVNNIFEHSHQIENVFTFIQDSAAACLYECTMIFIFVIVSQVQFPLWHLISWICGKIYKTYCHLNNKIMYVYVII